MRAAAKSWVSSTLASAGRQKQWLHVVASVRSRRREYWSQELLDTGSCAGHLRSCGRCESGNDPRSIYRPPQARPHALFHGSSGDHSTDRRSLRLYQPSGRGFRQDGVSAGGYNILIGLVKLGLAPAALHEANQKLAFDASVADPNSTWFYLAGTLLIPARLQGNVRDLQAALQTPGWRDRRCAGAEIPHWRVVWRRPYPVLLLDEMDKAEIFLAA
jgi:hypothetical protein